jgi:FhuF 2Fe-2S C-terminal domain
MPAPLARTDRSAPAFTGVYRRLSEVFPSLRIDVAHRADDEDGAAGDTGTDAGEGWFRADELAGGGAVLDAFLARDERQVAREHGPRARPDVVASLALHRYVWPACLLMTLPWFLARRVPRVPLASVRMHRALGRMTVRIEDFACLPGDPAAALPGARVVRDEEALRAELRAAVADHLAPVLGAFAPRMRRGRHALWGMATDEVVEGLWYVGHLLGEETRAVDELGVLLPGSTAPYTGSAAFRGLADGRGGNVRTRDRASCCLFYTLRPDDTCVTCPRTCDADRVRKLAPRA